MNIYVGNLNYRTSEEQVKELFEQFGEVSSVKIIKDYETGRSKGFGFVEMADDEQAQGAIDQLNETEFMEKKLVINPARPRTNSRPFNGGGSQGGGYSNDYKRSNYGDGGNRYGNNSGGNSGGNRYGNSGGGSNRYGSNNNRNSNSSGNGGSYQKRGSGFYEDEE